MAQKTKQTIKNMFCHLVRFWVLGQSEDETDENLDHTRKTTNTTFEYGAKRINLKKALNKYTKIRKVAHKMLVMNQERLLDLKPELFIALCHFHMNNLSRFKE